MGEWGCMRNRRVDSLPAKWASQISLYILLHFSVHFLRYRKPVGIKKQDEWKFDETWECQRVFYLFFFIWHFLTDTVASVSRFNIIFVNWTESQSLMLYEKISISKYSDFTVYIESSSMMIQQLYSTSCFFSFLLPVLRI